jgi:hypothetical protein
MENYEVIVTNHAITRYKERICSKTVASTETPYAIRTSIIKMLKKATRLDRYNTANQLFKNNYLDAIYYKYGVNILVTIVEDKKLKIVSMFKDEKAERPFKSFRLY